MCTALLIIALLAEVIFHNLQKLNQSPYLEGYIYINLDMFCVKTEHTLLTIYWFEDHFSNEII